MQLTGQGKLKKTYQKQENVIRGGGWAGKEPKKCHVCIIWMTPKGQNCFETRKYQNLIFYGKNNSKSLFHPCKLLRLSNYKIMRLQITCIVSNSLRLFKMGSRKSEKEIFEQNILRLYLCNFSWPYLQLKPH